mmetsp:Transcript_6144/g.8940  ORF Transcript_6144/g.8940 Transcript_6144/m.8940 type:complete len:210 (+) Transcript_6144:743-1372(+)
MTTPHLKIVQPFFLSQYGLVESFPLPQKKRRYICSTSTFVKNPDIKLLQSLITKRSSISIDQLKTCHAISPFRVGSFVASTFYSQKRILAGDAAHICSPLGGQGLNCGIMDAKELAYTLKAIKLFPNLSYELFLKEYESKQSCIAKAAIRRAELNTYLGRKPENRLSQFIRAYILPIILAPIPYLDYIVASYFTMRYMASFRIGKFIFA